MLNIVAYDSWALHALIWLPLVGMGHVLWAPEDRAKHIALRWSLAVFVLSLGLWWAYDPSQGAGYQLTSSDPWITVWGVSYALGVDGISLFMVLLSTFTTPLAILGSFNYIRERERPFYALMLLLEVGVVGVFLATDLFLFYVFFELTLVPMYFIVGIWGGERRIYAAVKFFLYTAFGSLTRVVELRGLECRPCGRHGAATCPLEHFRCMRELDADRVLEQIARVLGAPSREEREIATLGSPA